MEVTPIEMSVQKITNGSNWMWVADGPWGHAWGTAASREEALIDATDFMKTKFNEGEM